MLLTCKGSYEEYRTINFALKPNRKQPEAKKLLSTKKRIFLFGGRRSGKTTIFLYATFVRAMMYPGSRHFIGRLRLAHARDSIWNESLPYFYNKLPKNYCKPNKSEMVLKFWNKSEVWVGGFDDKDRVDKMLGKSFATMYFNEVSQIPYKTITTGLSSLAQSIPGLVNRAYFDCNPPSPMHWCHKMFIEGIDPETGEPLLYPEIYGSLLMNPMDNEENIPPDYISNVLDVLPERDKKRFKLGLFVRPEGMIFEEFDMKMVIDEADLPVMEYYNAGTDFGMNMAGVLMGWVGDTLFLIDDHGAFNTTAKNFDDELKEKGWHNKDSNFRNYCPHDAGERRQSITGGTQAIVSVEDGIDFLKSKMQNDEFFVCKKCTGWLSEVWDYKRDEKGHIIKVNDHFIDASRYGAFSFRVPAKLRNKETKIKPTTAGMMKEKF